MRRLRPAVLVVFVVSALSGAASVQALAQGVEITVLTSFDSGSPTAVAATNQGDIVALVGTDVVRVDPNGKQKPYETTISGGAFGIAIGIAYDGSHQLYAALPGAFVPPPSGIHGILRISQNGKQTTPVEGSDGMVAADAFGLDTATGDMYVSDIFGNAIWRFSRGGQAELWTSDTTNPLLIGPDGVKVFDGAVYTSLGEGKVLRIPINPDGSAGTAEVWVEINEPGVFFDDLVIDDRTGDVYVTRLDTNELLQITPERTINVIATNDDGLLGAANMTLIHVDGSTIIYLANTNNDFLGTGDTSDIGPAILEIAIG